MIPREKFMPQLRPLKVLLLATMGVFIVIGCLHARRVVLLHTNDTHSQIYPEASNGMGGVARRAAAVDSVRQAEGPENVMLIDAGDVVQGTLFFNIGGGRVEEELMNALGYDLRILGNHEFDNGVDSLSKVLRNTRAAMVSSNYGLEGTALEPLFRPYVVRDFGPGARVGFLGLNLDPHGMVAEGNHDGVVYHDAVRVADSVARLLRQKEGCDYVVAVTHLGYKVSPPPDDRQVAHATRGIDVIIGGHSHTLIQPSDSGRWRLQNAEGRPVAVVQAGRRGDYLGQVTLDTDQGIVDYKLIPIDSRLDTLAASYKEIEAIIAPYQWGVDSLMSRRIATADEDMDKGRLLNWTADRLMDIATGLTDGVEMALINKGGLRSTIPAGDITEGQVIALMPFNNYVTVLDISGADLLDNFNVMARSGGNGVSRQGDIAYRPSSGECVWVYIGGKPLDPDKTYRVATIDYLANGGDYMEPLTRGRVVARSPRVLYRDLINLLEASTDPVTADPKARMYPVDE